ncbi:hypothetical protein [Roseiterribacter gracilis]|uniref:Uncharacterized protein n=1 Tax=Roseiterribacter gracilis TaxID=2812848 RepID=A0A8S8XIP6_9PROT|nr:hypothetical protein TMPK1_37840 [Rhodospirillales bacterium TMPK1]
MSSQLNLDPARIADLVRRLEALGEPALGSVTVDEHGRPVASEAPAVVRLGVAAGGLPMQVILTRVHATTRCTIEARTVRLPYTAESRTRRASLRTLMGTLRGKDGVTARVAQDQTILLLWDVVLDGAATIDKVLVEILCFVQASRPHVEKLKAA